MPLNKEIGLINIGYLLSKSSRDLNNKWVPTIGAFLLYFVAIIVSSFLPFGSIVVGGPLTLGLCIYSLKIARGENVEVEKIFGGFDNFGNALGTYILKFIFIFLWTLLFIIPGIIATIAYSQSFYILADDKNKELVPMQVLAKSKEMMKGYKMDYFILMLTFFFFSIVCLLTLGIGYIWLMPYMQITTANFYLKIKKGNTQKILTTTIETEELDLELDSFEEIN